MHLWAVLKGHRQSKPLLARYHAFKSAQQSSAGSAIPSPRLKKKYLNSPERQLPPAINQAAAENLSPGVFAMLEKLGQSIVIVHFTWSDKPEITAKMHCGEELGNRLADAKTGYYDSTYYDLGIIWHFFYSKSIGEAVQILRDTVAEFGLLEHVTILQAEEFNKLVVWYPPTAQTITG
jgi:hypothetical protein